MRRIASSLCGIVPVLLYLWAICMKNQMRKYPKILVFHEITIDFSYLLTFFHFDNSLFYTGITVEKW